MKIVMTLLVRDEEAILRENLDFHAAQGVDFFIITDNGSQDGTSEIIGEYVRAGCAEYIWEPQNNYSQARWVTRMARRAATVHAADWVINNDADEFWWGRQGGLRDAFDRIPRGVNGLQVQRYNHPPVAGTPSRGFFASMIYRERSSFNTLGQPLPPKVCHRAFADIEVSQGNHSASRFGAALSIWASTSISISHFPMRDFATFERKIINGGEAYRRNTELDLSVGASWRQLYEIWREGGLRSWYDSQVVDDQQVARRLVEGALIRDDSILRALRCSGSH